MATPAAPQVERIPPALRLITPESYPTPAEAFHIWNKLNESAWFLDDTIANPYAFEAVITAPSTVCYLLGGPPAEGIAYAFGLDKDARGEGFSFGVAIAIWSKRAHGHVELIRAALRSVFRSHWNPHRAYALICAKNKAALRLAAHLNFKKEGDLRSALRYRGVWEDVALFGALRDEV